MIQGVPCVPFNISCMDQQNIKVRIVNSTTGVLIAGCETILSELPVDPAELEFKKAEDYTGE